MIRHSDSSQVRYLSTIEFCSHTFNLLSLTPCIRLASLLFAASLVNRPPHPPHPLLPFEPVLPGVLGAAIQSAFSLFLLPDGNEEGDSSAKAFAHGLYVFRFLYNFTISFLTTPPPPASLSATASTAISWEWDWVPFHALFHAIHQTFLLTSSCLPGTFLAADVYTQPLVALHNMVYIILGAHHIIPRD